ncbi:MAG: ammonium transporter [Caulobacteraceae bacterium]|nr:ammonium transporter [Caulobacteraceae bacterium]
MAMAADAAQHLLAHQAPLALDSGATAWMLSATALVLLMTLPGIALFYGGMVRKKNVLGTAAQAVAAMAVVTVLWFAVGYSLAFGKPADPVLNGLVGSFDAAFLSGVRPDTAHVLARSIPEFLWVAYQLTFAVITPVLIAGAFAERMKFSAFLLFAAVWHLVVYVPVAHWVWGGGFLAAQGVLDFAGGAVVHVNSGVAGLVCALVLGPRRGWGRDNLAPHNLAMTLIGASLLWVGWIGFNAGSALAADGLAATALINTLIASATGVFGWMIFEWVERRKPTLLGMLTGAVAGLVAITPAAGFVDPRGAFLIGLIGGAVCYGAAVWLKRRLKYDDSLDAFGVHGAGGLAGALLTGVFANSAINPAASTASLWPQFWGTLVVVAWSALTTLAILWLLKRTVGLRVEKDEEVEGLDVALHGEALHDS